jgi:hypothetical protein
MNKLRVGIVGLGPIAQNAHLPAIEKARDIHLQAIAETDAVKQMLALQRLLAVPGEIVHSIRSIYTKHDAFRFESGIWVASALVALLGVLTAARSEQPLFWLLVWPVPVAVACTIFILVRQGFHIEDGILVLGRRKG